ncbi:ATP synthase gamma chain [Acaryochloris thomasi RCC1774]|uniref:ATP synthase gamma chain n=1 Tax=Acaryochloris thomasi RCC1774 TaxID=1764569 RepID=A0A2W1J9N5_9CYAN|nr:F0F1 ATP synthase subunit gamma [Acaryochloris thomasi]PZD70920.1 ATP synthase gamma chain [Acaryochloris thomasi RCC1774]
MKTAEALKRQIASTQELQTVAKTMKALAAVNIRQYEQAAIALKQYSHTLRMGRQIFLINYPEALAELRPSVHRRLGAVIFGSDQGMCGRFNEQLAQYVIHELNRISSQMKEPLLLGMGSRVCDRIQEQGFPIERCLSVPASVEGITAKIQTIVLQLEQWRTAQQVDQIWVFHNRAAKGATSTPRQRQIFPLSIRGSQRPWSSRCRPMVSQSREQLFSALFRQHFFVTLYRACAESLASENASRLTSMQLAQNNITEHLTELQAIFQQQRQTKITEELLDIVSGFEALNRPH